MTDLVNTYRIQFHKGFAFTDLENILPYLRELGVKTIYASPIFKAVPGSVHGYDVTDPLAVNPEIGTMEQLRTISGRLKSAGINWLQDIVPNHMAYHHDNQWLMDVLEKGTASQYVSYFDLVLSSDRKIMAPFLGDSLAAVTERKELSIVYRNGGFAFKYYESYFPLQYTTYSYLLEAGNMPDAVKAAMDDPGELMNTLAYSYENNSEIKSYIDDRLAATNVDIEALRAIADEQFYMLCRWQKTDRHINYRRFFTINGLISLNMQNNEVFDDYHQLVKQLLDEQVFQGLRVDHVDGLYDPTGYLQKLRDLAGPDVYICVEKILEHKEELPSHWPIQGTTGYDFLAVANNLFTESSNKKALAAFYKQIGNEAASYEQEVHDKQADMLHQHFSGDLDNLCELFLELDLTADFELAKVAPDELKMAIGEFLVHCPVYRYYGNKFPLGATETRAVEVTLGNTRKSRPDLKAAIDVLEHVLLQEPRNRNDHYNNKVAKFYMRCMQYSGPLMAKGVEDTLMYTYNAFIAHNEVGDSPAAFGIKLKAFHHFMQQRQSKWSQTLNATATHDTKRGEDARMRLNVISDMGDEWLAAVTEWQELNKPLLTGGIPDSNEAYFIYQSLVAFYPMPGSGPEHFSERFKAYVEKALREAKRHTNWAEPATGYEQAVSKFIDALLDPSHSFLRSFEIFLEKIVDHGIVNSLSQVVLKYTCPGIPDLYQGNELWDLKMVDPDNRTAVDYNVRTRMLGEVRSNTADAAILSTLWHDRYTGKIKLWLTQKLMAERMKGEQLYREGTYLPLKTEGKYKDALIAYARHYANTYVVVVLPLHTYEIAAKYGGSISNIDWKDTAVQLPEHMPAGYSNILTRTKGKANGKLEVKDLFSELPFALLKFETTMNKRSAGILLPVFSLHSDYGIGDFGSGATSFIDFLHRSGQRYWQLLPLNPTEAKMGYSPYSSVSSMAANPLLISPELLLEDGLLNEQELKDHRVKGGDSIDYKKAAKAKHALLEIAWSRFADGDFPALRQGFNAFCDREAYWLNDFVLYKVLQEHHDEAAWHQWPDEYKWRNAEALDHFRQSHIESIDMRKWGQYIVAKQWEQLKKYSAAMGVALLGDMPFYVSYESADVWANPGIFCLDDARNMTGVAGVPPDYFSEDGQLWGMPTYNWDVLKQDSYKWWVDRLRKNLEQFDLVRLDHFRAFEAYWQVPAGEETARNGEWIKGPGMEFFNTVKDALGGLPFVAEDLGDNMDDVYRLRNETGLPGMKVLQFAWGDNLPHSVDIPHNYPKNCIVYSGTHDNNTTIGWYNGETKKADHKRMKQYLGIGVDEDNVHTAMARLAYASIADTAILPMQDVLGLDERARMNTPGSAKNNWLWRLPEDALDSDIEKQLLNWVTLFNRR